MHHALFVASRITAGLLGALAFYFAFFLYEDEEGVWQNRVENLWIAVYDRAKVTDSTTTALFNKVSESVRNTLSWALGKRLLSFRAVAVSADLSLCAAIVIMTSSGNFIDLQNIDATPSGSKYISVMLSIFFLFLAIIPGWTNRAWATGVSYLALICFLWFIAVMMLAGDYTFGWLPLVLILAIISDYFAVLVMRRAFGSIASSVSLARIAAQITLLFTVAVLIAFTPYFVWYFFLPDLFDTSFSDTMFYMAGALTMMNGATLLLCIVPFLMLVFVLLHRIIWPVLGRFIYPFARHKFLTNRKALVSVGSLCVTYALNPTHVGIQDLLKLLKG